MSSRPLRILWICQDPLLESVPEYEVDFIATGKLYTPHSEQYSPPSFNALWRVIWRYFRGYYDVAVFPAVNLEGTFGDGPIQGWYRNGLKRLAAMKALHWLMRRLRPKCTQVEMLDRYDMTHIFSEVAEFLQVDRYWKVNLSKIHSNYPFDLRWLPSWIYPPSAESWSKAWKHKDVDVFCVYTQNSEAKRRAMQWMKNWNDSGLNLYVSESPIAPQEYNDLMARSKIVVSPSGVGYVCFRHYQAQMHGAVPIIDETSSVISNLTHGENALLYRDFDEMHFRQVIREALADDVALERMAQRAHQNFREHHLPMAVGRNIIETAIQSKLAKLS